MGAEANLKTVTEMSFLANLLRKGTSKANEIYRSAAAARGVKAVKQAEKGLEAANKGGLTLAKYKIGRVVSRANTALNVAAAVDTAYQTHKAYKHGGKEEAAKTAVHEGLAYAPYLAVMRIPNPYLAAAAGIGLGAADIYSSMKGEGTFFQGLKDKYLPGLKPKEITEEQPIDDGDRAVEPSYTPYTPQTQSTQMQDYTDYPSDREIKRLQRKQMHKEYVRQRGLELIEQHKAEMFGQ